MAKKLKQKQKNRKEIPGKKQFKDNNFINWAKNQRKKK